MKHETRIAIAFCIAVALGMVFMFLATKKAHSHGTSIGAAVFMQQLQEQQKQTTTPIHGLKEPVYPPYCWVQPPGSDLWYECNSDGAKLAECANLMELAMKGVDPFIQDPSRKTTKEEELRIKKVWERAKNTCWTELRNAPENQHYH